MDFITLDTDRLILKGLSPADMNDIFTNLTKAQIMEVLGHRTEADYLKEEQKHKNGYASYNRSFRLFLLTDKTTGSIIGRCGLHNWNTEHKRAELGYIMVDENFKNKGLMSEAVEKVLSYGFGELELHRIEALTAKGNIASLKILEKNHFRQEGILRQHYFVNNTYEDSLIFAILFDEYKSRKIES